MSGTQPLLGTIDELPDGSPAPANLPSYEGFVELYHLQVTDEEMKQYAREWKWGTYGKTGKEPLKWEHLINLETEHLRMILITQRPPPLYVKVILFLLEGRAGIKAKES